MLLAFSAPNWGQTLPPSQGGGPVVTDFDVTAVLVGDNPLTEALATVSVPRASVSDVGGGVYQTVFDLSSLGAPVVNKDIELYVRETNPSQSAVGPYGTGSSTVYGGFPSLGPCNVISPV